VSESKSDCYESVFRVMYTLYRLGKSYSYYFFKQKRPIHLAQPLSIILTLI